MAPNPTLKDFLFWLHRDLNTRKSITDHAEYVSFSVSGSSDPKADGEEKLTIRLYTMTNKYTIVARADIEPPGTPIPVDGQAQKPYTGYLGCIASARTPRAGEGWHRGNDLPDGPLCEETWLRILMAIIQYELVRVQHQPLSTSGVIGLQFHAGPYETEPPVPGRNGIGPERPTGPADEPQGKNIDPIA